MLHHVAQADQETAQRLLEAVAGRTGPSGDLIGEVDEAFRHTHRDLCRWFGAEGTNALLLRALDRTTAAMPGFTRPVPAPDAASPLAGVPAYLRTRSEDEARDLLLLLLATLVALLGRLVGSEMASRVLDQCWPFSDGSSASPLRGQDRE